MKFRFLKAMAMFCALLTLLYALPSAAAASYSPVYPSADGKVVYTTGNTTVDASNITLGYVMVKNTGESGKLKVQIVCGDNKYNYDLADDGAWVVYPLQFGEGDYTVKVFENVTGSKYKAIFRQDLTVKYKSEQAPYLCPSQYVSYNRDSKLVWKASAIVKDAGAKDALTMVDAINNYLSKNVVYDKVKAKTVAVGYLPDPDETLATGKGICFDYAALMVSMLRVLGVPAKLIIGQVAPRSLDHAWVSFYSKEKGWVTQKVYCDGKSWALMDPTYAAAGGTDIEDFIGNATNYTALRWY